MGRTQHRLMVADMIVRTFWSFVLCVVLIVLAGRLGENTEAMDDIRESGETAATAWRHSEAFVRLMDDLREEASSVDE